VKTLEITSYVGCPNMCHYCPQELLMGEYIGVSSMTLNDFKRLLDNVPKDVRIDFSGFSEIFFHPKGAYLIKESIDRGYNTILYTTLEGFSIEDVELLKGLPFGEVVFHKWPGVDEDEFNWKVTKFSNQIQAGRVAKITPEWEWSRAGNVKEMEVKKGKFQCVFAARDFDHNVLMPNGDVYLCCQDYGLKHKIGNLYETNFDDLDRSEIVRLSLQEDSDTICRKCELFQAEE
jgi:radical SAM protein with 4Fe4S-binding SPASM domain